MILTGQIKLSGPEIQKILAKAISKRLDIVIDPNQIMLDGWNATVNLQMSSSVTMENLKL